MGGRLVILVALCASAGCHGLAFDEPDTFIGPGEVGLVDYTLNGSLGCDGGTIIVESGATVNGFIEAVDCKVSLFSANNGYVSVSGGSLLHIEGTTTINGYLEAIGVDEVIVADTGFNGDGYIEGSYEVTVINTSFNGELVIKDADRCEQHDNYARSIVTPPSCVGPL